MTEHDFEPVPGLPATLPAGERILWQGAPEWRSLALHAFHVRKVIVYFGILALWRVVSHIAEGAAVSDTLYSGLWMIAIGSPCVALLSLFAWASARSTLYTITNRRVVLRIGVALPMSINVPFASIDAASLRQDKRGIGDVSLVLASGQRLAYAVLWPHARRWQFAKPQPMLRTIPNAAAVANTLTAALSAASANIVATVDAKSATRVPTQHVHQPRSLAGAT